MNKQKFQFAVDCLCGVNGVLQSLISVTGDSYNSIQWSDSPLWTEQQLCDMYSERKREHISWKLFLEERIRRLSETDSWALSDRVMTQAQKDYRQSLRDLPNTADPMSVEGVTWPVKP